MNKKKNNSGSSSNNINNNNYNNSKKITDDIECPICQKKFLLLNIDNHINECLKKSESNNSNNNNNTSNNNINSSNNSSNNNNNNNIINENKQISNKANIEDDFEFDLDEFDISSTPTTLLTRKSPSNSQNNNTTLQLPSPILSTVNRNNENLDNNAIGTTPDKNNHNNSSTTTTTTTKTTTTANTTIPKITNIFGKSPQKGLPLLPTSPNKPKSKPNNNLISNFFKSSNNNIINNDTNNSPTISTSIIPIDNDNNNSNNNNNINNNDNNFKYSFQKNFDKKINVPLAEIMRPTEFNDIIGQKSIMDKNSVIFKLFSSDTPPSIILYGPTGCGKSTICKILARKPNTNLVELSAVGSGIKDVKEAIEKAKNSLMFGKKTILFIDEIHRYNKAQQDVLLPAVELGIIILIGATTENPSFEINNALLSRCKVFKLEKLTNSDIFEIIKRTIEMVPLIYDNLILDLDDDTIETLSEISDGDARVAINVLDMAIKAFKNDLSYEELMEIKNKGIKKTIKVTKMQLGVLLQRTSLTNDKFGDAFYELISALHKSVRGSDPNAAAYWVIRMLESGCNPIYIARRMIRMASEDIGLSDNTALPLAVAAYQAAQFVGMPECTCSILHCAVYLASASKSNSLDHWYASTREFLANNPSHPVPIHLRNAPTKLMKDWGYGKDYQYNHAYDDQSLVTQSYLPEEIKNETFFDYKLTCPSLKERMNNSGYRNDDIQNKLNNNNNDNQPNKKQKLDNNNNNNSNNNNNLIDPIILDLDP